MTNRSKMAAGIVGIFGFFFVISSALADAAATYLPPETVGGNPVQFRLATDRNFGFVPLTVNLSGMILTKEGDLLPVNAGQSIRVVVESSMLRVQSSVLVTHSFPDLHYESSAPGPATPSAFKRAIEIRRPGTYTFRVQVIAPDGRVLSSNDVDVRAL